jgi:hypothetical protein
MNGAGNREKLYGFLRAGFLISFIMLTVCFAGCTSPSQTTTQSTLPVTTVLPQGTGTVLKNIPASLPDSAPLHPIVGTWSFTDPEGVIATLTFFEDGRFSGTISGELSPAGTWKPVAENEYEVILSSGESWDYIYDTNSDTISDASYPDVSFTRQ